MKAKEKKELASVFLGGLAVAILQSSPVTEPKLRAALDKTYQKLITGQPKEVVQATLRIKKIFETLAIKLINCEDPDMVAKTAAYINDLNNGHVLIAQEGQGFIWVNAVI